MTRGGFGSAAAGGAGDVRRRRRQFLGDVPAAARSLETLRDVGLGYLRLGQPATELSGGAAQRIQPATELQRARRGHVLYLLDEPTAGLHPADIALLLHQLHRLVDVGNTVSWSSTTWTRSPPPTGSSTSARAAETRAGG
jgi:ABC-type Mn2+/Zn2+ transport system ATPase subunit